MIDINYIQVTYNQNSIKQWDDLLYNLVLQGSDDDTEWTELDVYGPSSFATANNHAKVINLIINSYREDYETKLYKYIRVLE